MTLRTMLVIGVAVTASAVAQAEPAQHSHHAAPAAAAHSPHAEHGVSHGFAASDAGSDRLEVTFSGLRFTSRDEVEGQLLYHTALLTRQRGYTWFVLLHMPGEAGAGSHPPRQGVAYGANYAHWQPHWNYYRADFGWQPWHPEWASPFWTSEVDPATVERFDVHAMVDMGRGPAPADNQMMFDTASVLKDLDADGRRR